MSLLHFITHSPEFFFLGLIYSIFHIHTDHRYIRRDFYNIHAVDLTELLLLCQRRTCHTALFLIFIKQILERDRCKSFALPFYFHALLGLNCLMKTVRISSSGHDTSRKLIDDQNFVILHHIILVAEHQVVGTESQNNIMLNLQIFRICKIINVEEFLYLLHTVFCKVDRLFFLIDNKVSCLLNLLAHNGIDLGKLTAGFSSFHLSCQNIAGLIELCRLTALPGDNKRSSGFIDQNRVNLINDSKLQPSLHKLFFIDHHIIS